MTNLANALELCPELPELVRDVIVMGGAFVERRCAEGGGDEGTHGAPGFCDL